MTQPIRIEVSPGELIDKITILEIKAEQIDDEAKLQNVRLELDVLCSVRDREIADDAILAQLTSELRTVNAALWDIEDEIRECEAASDFGARFVELARSVYRTNDRRAEIKRQINTHLGSRIVEEKSYKPY